MQLNDYPSALYTLELNVIAARKRLREADYSLRREDADLEVEADAEEFKGTTKAERAEARKRWLVSMKQGDAYMQALRERDAAEDAIATEEAELRRVRREWKAAQIGAQFKLYELGKRLSEDFATVPAYPGINEGDEDEAPVSQDWEQEEPDMDGPDDGTGMFEPYGDEVPF